MNKINEILINILKVIMIIGIGFLAIASINCLKSLNGDTFSNKFFFFEILTIILGSLVIFSKIRNRYKIMIILLAGVLLRTFWIFSVNTMPTSDFKSMYDAAQLLLTGDTSVLKGYEYLARFPHLIPMTFYMAVIIKIFSTNSLIVLKLLNTVFGTISIYLLYKLSYNFVKSEREKLFALLIGAIFPAFITYTSVLATENIAIPLYLASLIMFYNAKNSEKVSYGKFIMAGIILALGNLFRGVAIVVLIAFIIYILIDTNKKKFVNIGCLILGYGLVTLYISGILLSVNLIERPLWKGAEPSAVTLLLKGTNFKYDGMWNIDDAVFIENHLKDENLTELCLKKVKERLFSKSPLELITFYTKKFIAQWEIGDCAGTYWSYLGANINLTGILPITFQYMYVVILVLAFIGQFNRNYKSSVLLNIILFGFGLLFIIIETQARYSYIASWIFILFAVCGIEILLKLIRKGKEHVFKTSSSFKE